MDWFVAHDRTAGFEGLNTPLSAFARDPRRRQRSETSAALLADVKRRGHPIKVSNAQYYGLIALGETADQPSVELNAA